ncbi:hypothetical protein BV25DRAFT_1825524 [Artomyces pyxidatus]|uniref:Uncharacterized protein n=1 Tax=Artomyces pyxidatus TaxID=48021 RepID=A0ACB8T305_9AGAM|nr:hypothetical protein BV25DRAFT_1825524 [Artomyces pyxidatus]
MHVYPPATSSSDIRSIKLSQYPLSARLQALAMRSSAVYWFFIALSALASYSRVAVAAPIPYKAGIDKRYCLWAACRVAGPEINSGVGNLVENLISAASALSDYVVTFEEADASDTEPTESTPGIPDVVSANLASATSSSGLVRRYCIGYECRIVSTSATPADPISTLVDSLISALSAYRNMFVTPTEDTEPSATTASVQDEA